MTSEKYKAEFPSILKQCKEKGDYSPIGLVMGVSNSADITNFTTLDGETALHCCAQTLANPPLGDKFAVQNTRDFVKTLLEIGIDYTLKDNSGKTAAEYGDAIKEMISEYAKKVDPATQKEIHKKRLQEQRGATEQRNAEVHNGVVDKLLSSIVKIHFKIISAKDLPVGDSNGFSDPYVVVKNRENQVLHKTPVIKKTLNPDWDDLYDWVPPMSIHNNIEQFTFEVMDKDLVSADKLGDATVTLRELVEDHMHTKGDKKQIIIKDLNIKNKDSKKSILTISFKLDFE
eukprot:Phypoly_transcript_15154.p1 GENE.Phypoly_transcript_15154~~Phypoly_transcript_15154.p1  ORF type:complete len:287 (+),score=59.24 Phypoly_transcript_15154:79-939(+)